MSTNVQLSTHMAKLFSSSAKYSKSQWQSQRCYNFPRIFLGVCSSGPLLCFHRYLSTSNERFYKRVTTSSAATRV